MTKYTKKKKKNKRDMITPVVGVSVTSMQIGALGSATQVLRPKV